MKYRVWIAKDMNDMTAPMEAMEFVGFFDDCDEEGLSLLMRFMRHQGCAIAIMPALEQPETSGEEDA